MKQEEILNCILHPDRLKEIPFERLKQALTDYPYSQNLHFLLAQKSMQEQHPDFERHLKTAATYMNNRSFLRKQLQQSDRPSQPMVEPEPEEEPAQGNSSLTEVPEDLMANLPDEDLPTVEFIPDTPIDEDVPNHVADIITDTPPADQPPPNETSIRLENLQDIDPVPPIVSKITQSANQSDDPEIPPVEKKIIIKHEPIADQPRITHERIIIKAEPEEPIASGSNIPDLSEPQAAEVSDLDLELEDEIQEIETPTIFVEEPEIIEFPNQFDFDDEMDDLLSKPLIEVIPEKFSKEDKEVELEEDNETEISDLLLEDFNEILLPEDLDPATDEELTVQPKLGKWMKKYQSSGKQKKGKGKKRSKKKNKEEAKASKTKKKAKKTSKKKESDPKNSKKKKKKASNKKISKKKAIRKFANRSIVEDGETISMTLADLYAKQGKIEKAIVAYERLSLIIPEKKAFFASLIKKLKKK